MNNHLIEKIIESNGEDCPKSSFENPLIDRNVAEALSRSFVKILNISEANSNLNNNLRSSILENIRKLCISEPEGHLPIDENVTASLSELYIDQLRSSPDNSTDRELDAFLIRQLRSHQINSHYPQTTSPDIIQALMNLNDYGVYMQILAKDIIHLSPNTANLSLVRTLWNSVNDVQLGDSIQDDIALKMKPEIEKNLLSMCYNVLSNSDSNIEQEFTRNMFLKQLVKKAAVSSVCFQMCSSILNFLFVMTNFDSQIQKIITTFVKEVKMYCPDYAYSVLYPTNINNVALMLDFDISELPEPFKVSYSTPTLKLLKSVREKSEYDFIMLLSHFPQWFDIYFQNESV